MVQRLLLANDLPGVGKVALATSIPIAAACQVETILFYQRYYFLLIRVVSQMLSLKI